MTKKYLVFVAIFMALAISISATVKQGNKSKKEMAPPGMKTLMGKVSNINASKIVIENDYGAKREIALDAKTKYVVGNSKTAKMEDIKAGAIVKVTYRDADKVGTLVALDMKK